MFFRFFGRWHPTSADPYGGRLKKRQKTVTRWRKLRAFFYAKSKFDARLRSYRKQKSHNGGKKTSPVVTKSKRAPIAHIEDTTDIALEYINLA